MVDDSIFVLVVDLDSEEFFDALRRPHLDGIPRHPLANVDADLAADTLVKANLDVRDDDIDAVRSVPRRVFDAIDGAEAHASLAARAVIGNDDCDLFWLLLFARDLAGASGMISVGLAFFGSYATYECAPCTIRLHSNLKLANLFDCNTRDEYVNFGGPSHREERLLSIRRAKITAVSHYLPERRVTNKELEKVVDTSDEWIVERTGIRERRVAAKGQATSDLAAAAAKRLLETARDRRDRNRPDHCGNGHSRHVLSLQRLPGAKQNRRKASVGL